MINNIQVTLVAFAGGITFGVLTVYALFFNGLLLGVIGGLAIGAGNGIAFLRLISSHGPLEISCIVVGGVAGLRIGWALIRPGPLRRGTSLRREARARGRDRRRARSRGSCCAGSSRASRPGRTCRSRSRRRSASSLFVLFWGLVVLRAARQSTARAFARR